MRKAIRVCSLLCMALLLVGIMSCSNGSEPDVWEKVTSINDIKGTWEGSTTVDFLDLIGENGTTGDPAVDALYADAPIKMTVGIKYPVVGNIELTLALDFSNAIKKIAENTGMEPSEISQMMEDNYLTSTETETIPVEYFKEWVEAFSLTINQHKTKLKMEIDKETYIILEKK